MSDFDFDEGRRLAGRGAMEALDLWDDETLALLVPVTEKLQVLIGHLEERGLPRRTIATSLVSATLGVVLAEEE
jgi:hypothetical protein